MNDSEVVKEGGIGTIRFSRRLVIAQNGYAAVFPGTLQIPTSDVIIDVAIKRIIRNYHQEELDRNCFERNSDLMLLTQFGNHPNILRYYGSIEDNDFMYVFKCFTKKINSKK